MSSFLQRLRSSKLAQWVIAYLAAAWLALQAADVLTGPLSLSDGFQRGLFVVLGFGLLATLVLAWYHGEKGRQRASGPELLMLAALFAIGGGVLALISRGDPTAASDSRAAAASSGAGVGDLRPSLAVLPLVNRASPEYQSLVDGVFDELLTRLSRAAGLRLASRTSVEAYRVDPKTVREIGSELGVRYVLEGGLQVEGERVLLNLQLIDAANEAHLWSDLDEREGSGSLLDLQAEIAINAASRLHTEIVQAEWDRFGRISTDSDEAYALYLRFRSAIRPLNNDRRPYLEKLEEGVELLEEAIRIDPDFGWVYAFLGGIHSDLYVRNDPSEGRALKAKEALDRALELTPRRDYLAWFLAPYYRDVERDYDRALEETERMENTLGGGGGWFERVEIERRAGRWFEALETMRSRASRNPTGRDVQHQLGATYHMMRRYDDAMVYYDSVLRLDADYQSAPWDRANLVWHRDGNRGPWLEMAGEANWFARFVTEDWQGALELRQGDRTSVNRFSVVPRSFQRGLIHLATGDTAAARREVGSAIDTLVARLELYPDDDRLLRQLAVSYAFSGRRAEALAAGRKALEIMPPARDALLGAEGLAAMVKVFGAVGPADSSLVYLERVLSNPGPVWLSARDINEWVGIDLVRGDSRFLELLRRHGLE